MIEIDKGSINFNGTSNILLSELAFAINHIVKYLSDKNSRLNYDEILEELIAGTKPYKLIDAGMDPMDALEVVGMEGKVNLEDSDLYPDRTGEE